MKKTTARTTQRHYKAYYDAIKAKYPGIITIANERLTDSPMEFVDDHFYVTPEKFFQMADYYDKVDRSGPKIYVGEYAVNKNVGSGDLLGAAGRRSGLHAEHREEF